MATIATRSMFGWVKYEIEQLFAEAKASSEANFLDILRGLLDGPIYKNDESNPQAWTDFYSEINEQLGSQRSHLKWGGNFTPKGLSNKECDFLGEWIFVNKKDGTEDIFKFNLRLKFTEYIRGNGVIGGRLTRIKYEK